MAQRVMERSPFRPESSPTPARRPPQWNHPHRTDPELDHQEADGIW